MRINAGEPPDENKNYLKRYISLEIRDLQIGKNILNETNKAQVVISTKDQSDQYYETKADIGGTLNITRLDTIESIISGTFSFQAAPRFNNNPNISITEGRFDIRYN